MQRRSIVQELSSERSLEQIGKHAQSTDAAGEVRIVLRCCGQGESQSYQQRAWNLPECRFANYAILASWQQKHELAMNYQGLKENRPSEANYAGF